MWDNLKQAARVLAAEPRELVRTLVRAFLLLAATASAGAYLLSLAIGPAAMYLGSGGEEVLSSHLAGIPLTLFVLIDFALPISPNVALVFGGLLGIFVICFAAAFVDRGGFLASLRTSWKEGFRFGRTNFLVIMPIIAAVLLAAILSLSAIQESQGVQTGGLEFKDLFYALFSLSYAPVSEEIGYRITPFGTTVLFIAILKGTRPESVSFWRVLVLSFIAPDKAKRAAGLRSVQSDGIRRGISIAEWAVVAATSAFFGLAHYLSGGGWDMGKVSTASLAGFALAIVYLAYGAYAAVLLHWFFNYYFTAYDLAAVVFGGPLEPIADLIWGLTVGFGQLVLVGGLVFVVLRTVRRLT